MKELNNLSKIYFNNVIEIVKLAKAEKIIGALALLHIMEIRNILYNEGIS